MMQVPLHSMQRGLAFYTFSLGFRPFFLLSGLFAALTVPLWAYMYATGYTPGGVWMDGVVWHAHEMVFGYTAAVIAGFLLTAVPNWTKARPVKAWPLATLAALWLAGRIGMFWVGVVPWSGIVDILFLPAIALSLLPAVIRAQSYRNVVFFFILATLSLCNLGIHLDMAVALADGPDARTLLYATVHLVALMIIIFGGRVVPMFTRNALKLKGQDIDVKVPQIYEYATLAATFATVPAIGLASGYPYACGGVLLLAGVLNLIRMSFWHTTKTLRMPIVWILHAGYFWVTVGYLAEGYAMLVDSSLYPLALHVLSLGGIGTMTLAMMTRVSLGHTGRPLQVSGWITAAYIVLQAAILVRGLGGWMLPEAYVQTVVLAAAGWTFAFAVFSTVYFPILLRPRADEKA